MAEPRTVLLLCDYYNEVAATLRDHIESFDKYSRLEYHRLSMLGDIPSGIDLARFDVIVIHYSLVACSVRFMSQAARQRIAAFSGLKCIFVQDEYRFVNDTIAAIRAMGVHILFTCVPEREIEKVYPAATLPGLRKINVLTGYVPEELLRRASGGPRPPQLRPIDVGYRGRYVPAWLGELGQEKWRIGLRFREDAKSYGLKTDISFREEDRLYGRDWTDFLENCKAVLGTESGASVFDFTGQVQKSVDAALARDPTLDFDTLKDQFFRDLEGRITLAQISPRCFECAALGTVMILYEGAYSGRLTRWRHYIPLKKDHSNMDEVVAVLRDDDRLRRIAELAFEEVARDRMNSYECFIERVDSAMIEVFRPEMKSALPAYPRREIENIAARSWGTLRRRAHRTINTMIYKALFAGLMGFMRPETRNNVHAHLRKIYRTVTLRL